MKLGNKNRLTHGMTNSPEFYIWRSMKARCQNPKSSGFTRYGGRGIKVCENWQSFEAFIADMGKRPSSTHQLDRINNNADYSKENCRWATRAQQQNNKGNNRIFTLNGIRMTETEWCKSLGLHRGSISRRIKDGWPEHKALTTKSTPRNFRRKFSHT